MSAFGTLAFGLLVFYFFKQIPVIGFFTVLVVLWTGLGALTLRIFTKPD
jgi:hypothetical protein